MADIELVIKIPEDYYKTVKEWNDADVGLGTADTAIADGIPLPKGHSDLIDRNELLEQPIDTANYPSNYVRLAKAIIEADKAESEVSNADND